MLEIMKLPRKTMDAKNQQIAGENLPVSHEPLTMRSPLVKDFPKWGG